MRECWRKGSAGRPPGQARAEAQREEDPTHRVRALREGTARQERQAAGNVRLPGVYSHMWGNEGRGVQPDAQDGLGEITTEHEAGNSVVQDAYALAAGGAAPDDKGEAHRSLQLLWGGGECS